MKERDVERVSEETQRGSGREWDRGKESEKETPGS